MDFVVTKNGKKVKLSNIPELPIDRFREVNINEVKSGRRVVSFFGSRRNSGTILYSILADDENSKLYINSTIFPKNVTRYESLSKEALSFYLFEREFYEDFGIKPYDHPYLKSVRFPYNGYKKINIDDYNFTSIDGDLHEVGVGPIHAGVIEPGHFRFSCDGEKVINLEIKLGYQHRGVEGLFCNNGNYNIRLVESIAGDTVIGHTTAYSLLIEELASISPSEIGMLNRAIYLEVERIGAHLGDLAAICNDVAYSFGYNVFSALRGTLLSIFTSISGNRFGRSLIKPGGVNRSIPLKFKDELKRRLEKILTEATNMANLMFETPSVLARLERTGVLRTKAAKEIGAVGMASRASNIPQDIRVDHPYDLWELHPYALNMLPNSDVFSRSYIRYLEMKQSIHYILDLLKHIDRESESLPSIDKIGGGYLVTSLVEGWRGEIVHTITTNSWGGNIERYKVKDPSFNNWLALSMAMRNAEISDFPLCNKSFNLSYAGYDL